MKLEKNSYTVLCQEKNSITRGLGKKLDHVSFGELSIDVLANILVDYRSIYRPLCQPILGRLSTNMMATLSRYSLSVNSRPILCRRIPWSTCQLKCRSTCQSMNWSSGSLVSADCWSRGCVLADMGLVLGHYSLSVDHGTVATAQATGIEALRMCFMRGNPPYCTQIPQGKHAWNTHIKKIHAKIHKRIHTNQENLRVKLYTQVVIICVYSVYLSSYIAGWASAVVLVRPGGFNSLA